jgi:endonuclease YncB( thermonuclease family)
MKKLSYFILFVLFLAISLHAQNLSGRVIAITDGDTLKILTAGNVQYKVRLDGIDAPEKTQDFGNRAKEALSNLCFGKTVTVISSGTDKYGRTLGTIILDDNINVNASMVKSGYAWHYKQYSNDSTLAKLENEARSAKVGLWSQSNPTPPWNYRSGNKTSRVSPPKQVSGGSGEVYITRTGKKYHRAGCSSLSKSMIPISRADAQVRGYGSCGRCNP